MIEPWNTIHTFPCVNCMNAKTLNLLLKISAYLCIKSDSDELDPDFNVVIDEPINHTILLKTVFRKNSLKSYILDSLKRYHALTDIMQTLSECLNRSTDDGAAESFLEIIEEITKRMVLICTIESLSFESQRFLGNMIRKNQLPIPLAYYTYEENELKLKINFNPIAETFCYSNDRIALCLGSPAATGLGKTSLLPYLFESTRSESLNTDGNAQMRMGCIDTLFACLTKNEPYAIFDVHGTMVTANEDLITAIQQYCAVQILFVTESDMRNGEFLRKVMNFSGVTRNKPTIVIVFDTNYGEKHCLSSLETFSQMFADDKWSNTIYMTAPVFNRSILASKFAEERRLQRLRQTLVTTFDSFKPTIHAQQPCESIFVIQAYFLSLRSCNNAPPPTSCTFEILDTLKSLFDPLTDKTNNLEIVTPVNYLESARLECEKKLSSLWEESSVDLHEQLEQIKQRRELINSIPQYSVFFIDLLTKRTYIELLITERFLEKWRAQYESNLCSQLTAIKNDAMMMMSNIKHLEEQCPQYAASSTQAETENAQNQLSLANEEYKARQKELGEIENQLSNIDLTIGLFCDEILSLYEHLPKIVAINGLDHLLAKKFANLMHKGFSFHVLRGRPLRCNSKLIHIALTHLPQSSKKAPLVVTVIGEQSSAKSSLMNATFGCNFRVSAGRCTIGMYLSVIRWRDHTVIILDTEGLLSLEESGSIFDNQMVTLAMLSSHLVLINHKGEFSSNLEHLIGMSFYAKLQIRSPVKPKLLFILRDQSDTGATDIFFRQLAKFKENLYNDSKFLKSSIDDELDIDERNVILLPNAFCSDYNSTLQLEQTWRNRTFPRRINDLRNMILTNLGNTKVQSYHNVAQVYQKITSDWDAIDKLGPNLLACKTLYELSAMNELRDIVREINEESISAVNIEGRRNIDQILVNITHENCNSFDATYYQNQFNATVQNTCEMAIERASANYNARAERSCFPPEIKCKVRKLISPAIINMQGLLREEFDDRLYETRRRARVSNAQRHLIDTLQQEFDRNINLDAGQLQGRIDKVYLDELNTCRGILRSECDPPDQIVSKILKFYNSDLSAKAGNLRIGSIYNLLHKLELHQYREECENLDDLYQCIVTKTSDSTTSPILLSFSRIKGLFGFNVSDENSNHMWQQLYQEVDSWFLNPHYEDKNKKLLVHIIEELMSHFRNDIIKISEDFLHLNSSNPRMLTHVFAIIENLTNHQVITDKRKYLNLTTLVPNIAILALRILIDEAIKMENTRHEKDSEKMHNDMKQWKETITVQIRTMQDSLEQGKSVANVVQDAIFGEVGSVLIDKVLHDITEDIARSQFINHEAVQKQAYEESFGQGNGEKILKYVLNINRYFLELSMREIKTKLEAIVHIHTLNTEQVVMDIFNTVNDVGQRTQHDNVRLIADEMEKAIIDSGILPSHAANFHFGAVISLPIQNRPNFKQGFKTILEGTVRIGEEVAKLICSIKEETYAGCKARISRRLGCQSRCPGCGSKCSRQDPHDEEEVEQWYECKCGTEKCVCDRPTAQMCNLHETAHHIAEAFHGRKYYKEHTPVLKLCYQHWTGSGMYLDDELIEPLKRYYNQYQPKWYNNLNALSTSGLACAEDHPPIEQRRAWMIVRQVLLARYTRYGMVDAKYYDPKLYPLSIEALPADFEPQWNDKNDDRNK